MIYKEACVENIAEALAAQRNGAHRLEFCADLAADGLTPPWEMVRDLLPQLHIPVKVMIRPRAGDFCYSPTELATMKESIRRFQTLPIAGIVTGLLRPDQTIDFPALKALAEVAAPLPITFHKAIDLVADRRAAIAGLKKIPGLTSILTSGGAATAALGAAALREMIAVAGADLRIIAAGKVSAENLSTLHQKIGAPEYHGRRIVDLK